MFTRRSFVQTLAAAGVAGATSGVLRGGDATARKETGGTENTASDDRSIWTDLAERLATPVLTALAGRRLRASMPVEARVPKDRAPYTHLEAISRLLCGLAPWLELPADDSKEGQIRRRLVALARSAIAAGTDPASPDFLNFTRGGQPLVDAAFLAQAMLRAPRSLWAELDRDVQRNVVAALVATRAIKPFESNWQLFASEIEAFLLRVGEKPEAPRLHEPLRKFRDWYLGDATYGDGPEFHWDYYNSFVIHPMLFETLEVAAGASGEWARFREVEAARLSRYAAIQERLIAPDGSYPVIGRSIAYRCGAFQVLALAAWRRMLPKDVEPGQARAALTSVIRRTLEPRQAWDANGWLRIGLSGRQPGLGEPYISTGSLYLCSAAFLPLGLPGSDPFWSEPRRPTTWEKAWSGADLPADHALPTPKA